MLLVDVVGELGAWWGTARIGFVGGSLSSRGGQNMIEPAAYGVATSFGPNTQNFRDVVAALLAADAAVEVADGAELVEFVRRSIGRRRLRDGARPPRTKLRRGPARRDDAHVEFAVAVDRYAKLVSKASKSAREPLDFNPWMDL